MGAEGVVFDEPLRQRGIDHDVLGRDIALKFGLDWRIVNAIYAHHEAEEYKTIEARIVQVSDAISASRPGARPHESFAEYLERIGKLEDIAKSYEGVDKTYAIQAGREIRVIVNPDKLSDKDIEVLAKNIAGRIENELNYPGEVMVNVIRETKVVDYAK